MDLIGKNGKIDGILAAQVLLDGGVFFFKPENCITMVRITK